MRRIITIGLTGILVFTILWLNGGLPLSSYIIFIIATLGWGLLELYIDR